MFRRGFSSYAQTELAFLRGKHASKDYIKTIFGILTPLRFAMKMTLISIKIHLKGDNGIFFFLKIMEWVACSADLNPISFRYIYIYIYILFIYIIYIYI